MTVLRQGDGFFVRVTVFRQGDGPALVWRFFVRVTSALVWQSEFCEAAVILGMTRNLCKVKVGLDRP